MLSTSEEAPVRLAGSPLAIPAESAAENTENVGTPLAGAHGGRDAFFWPAPCLCGCIGAL